MIDPSKAALLMIDMQQGFISDASSLCIAGAQASVSSCAQVLKAARSQGLAIFHVRRRYAEDGSNVEPVRYKIWAEGGRPLCEAGDNPHLLDAPESLAPISGEQVVYKPRFSAFFGTALHEMLQDACITTVVLIGTTTPNCIRSTCYDALSLNYNVVVVEDATSSRTPEVQAANIEDMAFIGAHVMTAEEFCTRGLSQVEDVVGDFSASVEAYTAAHNAS